MSGLTSRITRFRSSIPFTISSNSRRQVASASAAGTGNSGGRNGDNNSEGNSQDKFKNKKLAIGAALLGFGTGVAYYITKDQKQKSLSIFSTNTSRSFPKVFAASSEGNLIPGQPRPDLPTYTAEDVSAHNSLEKGIWVSMGGGVYDITEYVTYHPGGRRILMAAGKSIQPFWDLYSVHKNEEIYETLESMRIGNIKVEEVQKSAVSVDDPYRNEPERSALLIPSSSKPFNAEPPQQLLTERFLTPNHLFFVRNHLPVPVIDPDNFKIDLDLPSGIISLSLDDLKKNFKKTSVTCVTQCAGNRRSEMVKVKPVKGLNWNMAAISNAKWSGVSLDELLLANGVDIDKVKAKHIVFEGMDLQPDGSPYGASIPIDLARLLKKDILLAYQMNNQDIPRDHGYPLRIVIPGVVGARQVKWANKLYFSHEESHSHWQRRDYKGFNSSIDWHNVDFDRSVSISQLPVISAITEPEEGAVLEDGAEEVSLKGYAWSGGGRGIIRVDVSIDGGKTWTNAKLKPNNQSLYKAWAWTLWEADVPLPAEGEEFELVVKAVDVSYNVQPDSVEGIWNLRGCLSNAWHRINVKRPVD